MLDVQQSFAIEDLLQHPTVLELEGMGDDDDKAFLIGLLLIRLFEYTSKHGNKSIQHLLVIEEAHRLLTNVSRNTNQEQSDPRGEAVRRLQPPVRDSRLWSGYHHCRSGAD